MLTLLYGGTFDPVHAGHLALARAARDALQAVVTWLPAADPPHRDAPGASAEQRALMLELVLRDEPGMRVDRREAARATPSWSVVTLREVRAEVGADAAVAWLIGADAFRGLASWHEWRDLFALCHFVVARRPGHGLEALPDDLAGECAGRWASGQDALSAAAAGRVLVLDIALHPASASELRQRIASGEDTQAWLDPAVAAYIRDHQLYQRPAAAGV